MIADVVENYVVAFSIRGIRFREILLGVINDVIRADGADHVHISGAAYGGYVCAEGFGDLHSEGSDASGGAVDQDFLSRLNMPLVTKTLQRSECRYRYGRGLFERDVLWFDDECRLGSAKILGKGSFAQAEDGIAWFELGDVLADGFDLAGHINAGSFDFWFAQPEQYASDVRSAFHEVRVKRIDACRADFD